MMKSFFENRRLRKDLSTADAVHMVQLDDLAKLRKEVALHETRYKELSDTLSSTRSKLTKTRKLVRAQTGADLLVNALRELGVVPKPDNHTDRFKEAARLQTQANAMAQGQHGGGLGQQLGGQGGLGGLF